METETVIAIVVVVLVVAVLAGLLLWRQRRTQQMEQRFGPEYDRAVEQRGRREAERELAEREQRRSKLDIRPLGPAARERYASQWRSAQAAFVDSPEAATREADLLVAEVMRDRGYPMDDFEQRAADISVDHPDVVEHYRSAHRISVANDSGEATTEELREAMRHYRMLFERLLEDGQRPTTTGEEARR